MDGSFLGLAVANFVSCVVPGQCALYLAATSVNRGVPIATFGLAGMLLGKAVWTGIALTALLGLTDLGGIEMEAAQRVGSIALIAIGAWIVLTNRAAQPSWRLVAHVGKQPGIIAGYRNCAMRTLGIGFGLALANPLALVFFMGIFPQALPIQAIGPAEMAWCLGVVVFSSVAGFIPYLFLGTAPFSSALRALFGLAAGLSIMIFGSLALLLP